MFGFDNIIGAVGSGALTVNAVPTTPPAGRISRLKKGIASGSRAVRVFALNGTTISTVLWVYEETLGVWLPMNAAIASTPSAPNQATVIPVDGAQAYLQVTAVTGVEAVGWFYG